MLLMPWMVQTCFSTGQLCCESLFLRSQMSRTKKPRQLPMSRCPLSHQLSTFKALIMNEKLSEENALWHLWYKWDKVSCCQFLHRKEVWREGRWLAEFVRIWTKRCERERHISLFSEKTMNTPISFAACRSSMNAVRTTSWATSFVSHFTASWIRCHDKPSFDRFCRTVRMYQDLIRISKQ